MYTVGQVAQLAGISIRTLHHYDEIGLVSPSERTAAGYRQYSVRDLERLQQVLFYKELGLKLRRIRELMADPAADRREVLLAHRDELQRKAARLDAMAGLIDRTLAAIEEGEDMTPQEMFGVFGNFDPSDYEDETRERWGRTEAYRESIRRTKAYTREDWERVRAENLAVTQRMLAAFDRGLDPEDPEAMDVAEEARRAIDRAFYPCTPEMHEALAEGYMTDARFRAYYDDQREGLAAWFSAAIRANARRTMEKD